jgi:hypothetical protein
MFYLKFETFAYVMQAFGQFKIKITHNRNPTNIMGEGELMVYRDLGFPLTWTMNATLF